MKRHIKPAYARFDPAHLLDGLFVPTRGKKRERLYVAPRDFDGVLIGYQGFEQLGADDQSVLLAIAAQLGIDGDFIGDNPPGPVAQELRSLMDFKIDFKDENGQDQEFDREELLASRQTTLRSLLIDAGYKEVDGGRALADMKNILNRLSNAQIRERSRNGWDRRCNLVSASFDDQTGKTYIAINPRLTKAVFHGQCVKISLFERNVLDGDVAKILHSWLSSNIRPGWALGRGNGARIDTLATHVWGPAWEAMPANQKSRKRCQFRDALDQIKCKTEQLHDGYGWAIDQTSSGMVQVSRPKRLPLVEIDYGTPACLDKAEMEDFERNSWDEGNSTVGQIGENYGYGPPHRRVGRKPASRPKRGKRDPRPNCESPPSQL